MGNKDIHFDFIVPNKYFFLLYFRSVKLCANQRIPGLREGQVYSYPSARWRKTRRQYLLQRPFPSFPQYTRPFGHLQSAPDNTDSREVFATEIPNSIDNDSRDSQKDSQVGNED